MYQSFFKKTMEFCFSKRNSKAEKSYYSQIKYCEICLVHGNRKGIYSNGAAESSLDGEKITYNVGNITMQKSKNFELYVQCLTNVGENLFKLMDQVTL